LRRSTHTLQNGYWKIESKIKYSSGTQTPYLIEPTVNENVSIFCANLRGRILKNSKMTPPTLHVSAITLYLLISIQCTSGNVCFSYLSFLTLFFCRKTEKQFCCCYV